MRALILSVLLLAALSGCGQIDTSAEITPLKAPTAAPFVNPYPPAPSPRPTPCLGAQCFTH